MVGGNHRKINFDLGVFAIDIAGVAHRAGRW